jgi:assimilatory nitrate reductase catalytic subunit
METTPRFLQGIFPFTGEGFDKSSLLGATLSYMVPGDKRAQLIYLRAGNSSDELIVLTIVRDGKPMRLFPIGAKADSHISLAVVEDLMPDTKLDVFIAAPSGVSGSVVLDIGLLEIT